MYDRLAAVFIPSIGLEDIIAYTVVLTKFTQVLNDSWQSLSLLNTEISLIRKTVLQNIMALDIIPASQGDTCTLPKKDVVFIPDDSANVPCLLNQMRTQVNDLSDPIWIMGLLVENYYL